MKTSLSLSNFTTFGLEVGVQIALEHLESKVKEVAHALSNEGARLDHLSVAMAMAILKVRLSEDSILYLLDRPYNKPGMPDLWITIRDLIVEFRTDTKLQHDEATGTNKIFEVLDACRRLDSLQEKYMIQERNRTPQIPPILLTGATT